MATICQCENMHSILEKLESDGETVCIYRVAHYLTLRGHFEFHPQEVFVGLYTHTQLKIDDPLSTDRSKVAIAQIFCHGPRELGLSWGSSPVPTSKWDAFVKRLRSKLRICRKMYDNFNLQEAALLRAESILLLDALFIVAFLRYGYSWADCWGYAFGDELNHSRFLAQRFPVLRDLVLVENQVPMSLLAAIVQYFVEEQTRELDTDDSAGSQLYELLAWFVLQVYPFNHGLSLDEGGAKLEEHFAAKHKDGLDSFPKCKHLLECVYIGVRGPEIIIESDSSDIPIANSRVISSTPRKNLPQRFRIPSATSLKKVGIAVKMGQTSLTMNKIDFVRHKHRCSLLVPKLTMNDNTAPILRNLALFEQIRDNGTTCTRGDLRTYQYLMSSLAVNVHDVRLLINSFWLCLRQYQLKIIWYQQRILFLV